MKQFTKLELPIDKYLPEILTAVGKHSTVMLKASPGSGKTTRLPWALAQEVQKKVAVLEPRRLAAKMAAMRIAQEENLTLGLEVGHHFRFENKTSPSTQLIFYTEGTFLKKFQSDPLMQEFDIIILDEFHERHLETDLALALLREIQKSRTDLKIILMSATLDTKIENSFEDAKTFEITAPMYPVEISYLPNQPSILTSPLELKVRNAIKSLPPDGDILVFLPGMREMLKVQSVLSENVFLLHADLTKEEQEQAISPSNERKVILATNIAESSVTIPGIKFVIDSGIQREAQYSAWNGLKLMSDVPITQSSAIQRAGRAGRTGPGKCLRLYAEQDFKERSPFTRPEIEKADLTNIYLLLKDIKLTPLWFELPPKDKWQKAQELLTMMGAIMNDELTPIGKKMLEYPLDARLSRVLVEGEKLNLSGKKSLISYLCEEIENDKSGFLKQRLSFFLKTTGEESSWERCLLPGFIDQCAKFRAKQRDFIHYSGKAIKAHPKLTVDDEFVLILDITQRQEAILVFPILEEWLWEVTPFPFTEEMDLEMSEKILIREKTKLGRIVLEEKNLKVPFSELNTITKTKVFSLSESIKLQKLDFFKSSRFFERAHFWSLKKNLPIQETLLKVSVEDYFNYRQELSWDQFEVFLEHKLSEELGLTSLSRDLPEKLDLGGKRELLIHYPLGMNPFLEAPIQDFYGLSETPSLMEGSVPITLKLLGPHKRPMQVTQDLKNFWHKTYMEMKKEYQRDYPRHYWPDKPWEAKPILLKSWLPKA